MPRQGHISPECQLIINLHLDGLNVTQIVERIGCGRGKVYSTLSRHGYVPNGKPVFDWAAIQAYYDEGNSLRGCMARFGMSSRTLTLAVRKGLLKTRDTSTAMKLGIKLGKIVRPVATPEYRKGLSEHAKRRGLGGQTNYYHYQYRGIHMDSQWEVDVAIWLDEHQIEWQRGRHLVFDWVDQQGESHRYYPDFYLPAFGVYLDPKNPYLIKKDRFKIEAVIKTHGIQIIWGSKDDVLAHLQSLYASVAHSVEHLSSTQGAAGS